MKVGDLVKLRDGTVGLVVKLGVSPNHGAPFFIIHTGEAFYPDNRYIEGWEEIA